MSEKKPVARVGRDGYLQVQIAEPPGCLERAERWLVQAAGYAVVFALGVLVGMALMGAL